MPKENKVPLSERRCHPRRKVRGITTWMLINDGKPEPCRLINVSRKGVRIESRRFLLPGMKVELAFVKADAANVTRLIRRCGEVVRSSPRGFAAYFPHPRPRADLPGRRGLGE